MKTLEYIRSKFNLKGLVPGTEIHGINRTIMAQTLHELGFTVGVEVGVAEGNHAKVLLDSNPDLVLTGVDCYVKYPGYEEYGDPAKCYKEAKTKLEDYKFEFIKDYSANASLLVNDDELDFVYIDGGHDFLNVAQDIAIWSCKVRPGGIVFGHDYKFRARRQGKRHPVHVKPVVDAFMQSHGISNWFVLTNDTKDPTFGHDNPGWLYIRSEADEL